MKNLTHKPIERSSSGGDSELKILYYKYYDTLVLFGHKFFHDQAVIEDIVQEAFIKFWERRVNFNSENAIRAFLYKTVHNSCINQLEHLKVRKKYSQKATPLVDTDESFSQFVIEEEVHRAIAEAVNNLPESARAIYLMSLNGVKNYEIAEDLNISINTVKTQKMRAKHFLREKLKYIYRLTGSF
jgi:RNA polymerase sigma-70 factor (ECF subfamily)